MNLIDLKGFVSDSKWFIIEIGMFLMRLFFLLRFTQQTIFNSTFQPRCVHNSLFALKTRENDI